jgi:hypothetical protein
VVIILGGFQRARFCNLRGNDSDLHSYVLKNWLAVDDDENHSQRAESASTIITRTGLLPPSKTPNLQLVNGDFSVGFLGSITLQYSPHIYIYIYIHTRCVYTQHMLSHHCDSARSYSVVRVGLFWASHDLIFFDNFLSV